MYTTIYVILNILSACLTIGALIYIGKFFCVKFVEDVYEDIESDYESKCFFHVGYIICLVTTIFTWIVYVFGIGITSIGEPVLCIIGLVFSSIFGLLFMIILMYNLICTAIVPFFYEIHNNIKRKKRG
ncbi:hypothetical protein A4_232 [Escherichia phage A4]|nr:hypothetical protein A4_232 [Escherichia phage A4]